MSLLIYEISYDKTIKRFVSLNFFAVYVHSSRAFQRKIRFHIMCRFRNDGRKNPTTQYNGRIPKVSVATDRFLYRRGIIIVGPYGGREKGCDAAWRGWRLTNFAETEGERLQNQKKKKTPLLYIVGAPTIPVKKNFFFY